MVLMLMGYAAACIKTKKCQNLKIKYGYATGSNIR